MEVEEQSQGNYSNFFSVRIVSIDYYMSPPIPDFDISYSTFQGGGVKEVPVIRIYGSTPAGQKACLHVHRALPYLYVPYSEVPVQSIQGIAFENAISFALEKALKLKGHAGSKRQHVHGCTVVRAKKFYGYHSTEELFIKIYLYYPHDVSRAASLLLDGAVFERSVQPYEAHIPFLLQFLIDYNLYGMGHMHLVKMKFRHPVPVDLFRENSEHSIPENGYRSSESQADATAGSGSCPAVWNSSTISDDWMWECPSEPGASSNHVSNSVKRQSICELEGDTTIEDILNQQLKLYTSLSQTCSDVRMVQSLIPIWEEEYERSGVQHADLLGDPGKPPPQDVLTTLSNGTEFQDKLRELYCKAEGCFMTMSEEDVKPITSAQCLLDERIPGRIGTQELNELGSKPSDDTNTVQSKTLHRSALDGVISALSFGEKAVDATNLLSGTEAVDSKCADPEDVALLKWLASSQAGEDIDSDDELHRMTILNPVVPSATVDAVLEKANTDYESESQQECQDILDSVVDVLHQDEQTRKISSTSQDKAPQEVSNTRIPQLDGSGDDQPSTPAANLSVEEMERMTSKRHSVPGSSSVSTKRKRHKMQWGSLPFSETLPVGDGTHSGNAGTKESGKCSDLVKVDSGVHSSLRSTIHNSSDLSSKYDDDSCCSVVDSKTLRTCSIRDLMRKRRCFRVESSECEKNKVAEICDKEKDTMSPRKLDFHLEQSDEQDLQDTDDGLLVDNKGKELDSVKPSSKSSSFCLTASDIVAPNTGSKLCDCRAVLAFEVPKNTASSSSVCLYQFQGKRKLSEDEHDVKCAEDIEICDQPCHQLDLQKPKSMSGTTHHQIAEDDTVKQYASISQDLGSPYGCLQHERGPGYLSMTFHKKPPIVDWTYGSSEDTMPTATLSYCSVTEDDSDSEERPVRSKSSEDVLPFFGDFHNHYSKQMRDCVDFFQKSSLGIPTHHQNDGSFAYLLTPAISPPSVGSVLNWLSVKDEEKLLKKPLPEFSHRVESSHQSPLKPISSHIDQEKDTNLHFEGDPLRVQAGCSEERKPVKVKQAEHFSQDISQISGPSGQSKPTPLSQIGFKDPASIGAGQQLTLLSIEIQAVSRGDLRPDPQHDAINAIALVFQNDDSASVDIHVLLRGEPKTFGRYVDGQCKVIIHSDEAELLEQFIKIVCSTDPDIVMGWDIQSGSLGYLAERASYLGINLVNRISRTPSEKKAGKRDQDSFVKENSDAISTDSLISGTSLHDNTLIEDEWGRTHASGVHVSGRIVLNVWRLVRGEVKLNLYTLEAVVEAVLRRKVPYIHSKILNKWFSSGTVQARFRCINYVVERAKLNHEIVDQLDMINRTSELARVFGIDFFSVLSRGSQYRVESMLVRLAHTQNYVLISPGVQQVASQPAMECIPLVMEPESGFYSDPVIVLDFQSLYPSMIIAYNLCYSTCIGNVVPSKADTLGVSSYSQDLRVMKDLKSQTLLTPNGVMYVPSEVRRGVLPQLLKEILSTRIMVKQAMKKLTASQNILHRIFNARQLALKLIANVTYGYTAAGFSGRMPCAELADSIVQCGRRTLEHAISVVNTHNDWNARVIYGDTDSMFVLLKGRSRKEAFRIGSEIASTITAMNPDPVTLKMEKVYQSCFLLSKKRYVGYSYESLNQLEPIFDAKGIETVRRDTCAAVAKTMEKSLRMFFECQNISQVREFLQRQWSRILSGRISIQDFVFAKEVRLGTYSTRTSCLPPAAIVASKAMRVDPRAEPRYAERVPYVVVHGEPGVRLIDMVVDPQELLALESPYRLNDVYYISKQIIPALQRVFGLVGADLNQWFQEMPRHVRDAPTKHYFNAANSLRARIDHYYSSRHCVLCGELARAASRLCEKCFKNGPLTAAVMTGRTAKLERDIQHLAAICRHCGGGDWVVESGVKCTSLACTVYYERVKAQKELRAFSSVATEAGFYPKCMVEWF